VTDPSMSRPEHGIWLVNDDASSDPERRTRPGVDRRFIVAVLAAGLTIAATYRQGGFYRPDALAVTIAALVLVVVSLLIGVDRRGLAVAASVGALAAWWLCTAAIHHHPMSFLPLGASIVGFLAVFLAMRGLATENRESAALGLAVLGAATAGAGLVAVALRWYPLAIPDQSLWRAAATLTYSNAAGSLMAIALLVGMGLDLRSRWPRVLICLMAAGLVASESRGAALAGLVALPLIPLGSLKQAVRPVVLGVIAGLLEVATSFGSTLQPVVLGVVVVLVVLAGVVPPRSRPLKIDRRVVVVVAGTSVVALVLAVVALHSEIALRLDPASTRVRGYEWSAALAQWRTSPLIGVGPDALLILRSMGRASGHFAHFAHNEYLQVLADAGLVGLSLLGLAGICVGRSVRRIDVGTSCAAAALVAAAVAACFDFDWHLPALALAAGWAAGLAGSGSDAAKHK